MLDFITTTLKRLANPASFLNKSTISASLLFLFGLELANTEMVCPQMDSSGTEGLHLSSPHDYNMNIVCFATMLIMTVCYGGNRYLRNLPHRNQVVGQPHDEAANVDARQNGNYHPLTSIATPG